MFDPDARDVLGKVGELTAPERQQAALVHFYDAVLLICELEEVAADQARFGGASEELISEVSELARDRYAAERDEEELADD